jgi:hypothetical protein
MAVRDAIFLVGRRSEWFQWVPRVFRSGVQFYIWATAIFPFAGTGFEKTDHEKGKITRNLGFYFKKIA